GRRPARGRHLRDSVLDGRIVRGAQAIAERPRPLDESRTPRRARRREHCGAVRERAVRLSRGRGMTAITADALGKRYGSRWALRDCTLSIPERRVVGLVGANGAGKSTLLHLAVGLTAPSAGSITTLGVTPAVDTNQRGRVGFLAQDAPAYATLSVADHLRLGE